MMMILFPLLSFFVGAMINIMSPGNAKRLQVVSDETEAFPLMVFYSFRYGVEFIRRYFNNTVFLFIIIAGLFLWISFEGDAIVSETAGSIIKKSRSLKFNSPLIVTALSFGVFCASFAANFHTKMEVPLRVENNAFFLFILLLLLNEWYLLGWIRSKNILVFKKNTCFYIYMLILFVTLFSSLRINHRILAEKPGAFLTSAASFDLRVQTAQYYGFQMAENTRRLMTDEKIVEVLPLAVEPFLLFPKEADEWIAGARLYYGKERVVFEDVPWGG